MSQSPEDRRQDDRMPVKWAGTLETEDERAFPCTVEDVSLAGTAIECDADVDKGDEVLLSIPQLGDFAGTVQWVRPPQIGLALQAGPDLLLKRIAEDDENYPGLADKAGPQS